MASLQVFRGSEVNHDQVGEELDLATIRRRVASIKQKWSPETNRARAIEGARRRRELAALLSGVAPTANAWELCDPQHESCACL
jgi:hypothetical protein